MRHLQLSLVAIQLLVLLLTSSCISVTNVPTEDRLAGQLENMEYQFNLYAKNDRVPVRLTNGKGSASVKSPFGENVTVQVSIPSHLVAVGDLNGDDVPDGAAVLVVNTGPGGQGTVSTRLGLTENSNGTLRNTKTPWMADYIEYVSKLSIANGKVVVNGLDNKEVLYGLDESQWPAVGAMSAPTPEPTHRIGEAVSRGNWSVKVTKAVWERELSGQFAKRPQGAWLTVLMDVVNVGSRTNSLTTRDLEVRDQDGRAYTPDAGLTNLLAQDQGFFPLGEGTPPGVTSRMAILFDVNPSAKGLKLWLTQSGVGIELR